MCFPVSNNVLLSLFEQHLSHNITNRLLLIQLLHFPLIPRFFYRKCYKQLCALAQQSTWWEPICADEIGKWSIYVSFIFPDNTQNSYFQSLLFLWSLILAI